MEVASPVIQPLGGFALKGGFSAEAPSKASSKKSSASIPLLIKKSCACWTASLLSLLNDSLQLIYSDTHLRLGYSLALEALQRPTGIHLARCFLNIITTRTKLLRTTMSMKLVLFCNIALFLVLASCIQGYLYPTCPIKDTVYLAGKAARVMWIKGGQKPLLTKMGTVQIDLYTGHDVSAFIFVHWHWLWCWRGLLWPWGSFLWMSVSVLFGVVSGPAGGLFTEKSKHILMTVITHRRMSWRWQRTYLPPQAAQHASSPLMSHWTPCLCMFSRFPHSLYLPPLSQQSLLHNHLSLLYNLHCRLLHPRWHRRPCVPTICGRRQWSYHRQPRWRHSRSQYYTWLKP